MTQINFLVRFSLEGRRACALAGLPAQKYQVFKVGLEDVPGHFRENIWVSGDGSAWLTTERTTQIQEFDPGLAGAAMLAIETKPGGHAEVDVPIADPAAYLFDLATMRAAHKSQEQEAAMARAKEREQEEATKEAEMRARCAVWAALPVGERVYASGPFGKGRWCVKGVGYGDAIKTSDMERINPSALEEARAEAQRRNNAEAAQLAEQGEREAAARDEWIRAHGSQRLRKCLDLQMADKCAGIYRSERLEIEFPGAEFDSDKWKESEIRNPSLEALEALEAMRKHDPGAELIKVRNDENQTWQWVEAVRFNPGDWSPRNALILIF